MGSRVDGVIAEGSQQADFTGWVPIRLFVRDAVVWVDWLYCANAALPEVSFRSAAQRLLQQPFNQAFRRYSPIAALVDWASRCEGLVRGAPLHALVAHVSRSGAALLGHTLARSPAHRVVTDFSPIDFVLSRDRLPANVTRDMQVRWLRALVFVLGHAAGQWPEPPRYLVLTLDAWHLLERELLAEAFPNVAWVLLFRDPVEVAASQWEQPAPYMVPGMVDVVGRRLETARDSGVASAPDMPFAAGVLRELFGAAARLGEGRNTFTVAYRSLQVGLPASVGAALAISANAMQGAAAGTPSLDDPDAETPPKGSLPVDLAEAVRLACTDAYQRLQAAAASVPV